MKCGFVLVGLLWSWLHVAHGYNVLFMLPFGSKSHKNVFDPVAEELVKRGHKVDMFSAFEEKKDPPGVRSVFAKDIRDNFEKRNISFFQGTMGDSKTLSQMFKMIYDLTELTFQDPFVADIVKQPLDPSTKKPKYDVVVVDAVFNDFAMALGHHMGVPNIIMSPSMYFHHHAWNLNVPYPLSYVPSAFAEFPEPMDFVNRAFSSYSNLFFLFIMNHIVLPNEDVIVQKYLPNTPPLVELNKNVSFMLSNTHPAIQMRQPGMPYTAEVGGLNCKPAKPLPKELENFMKEAGKDGVIYFALGSVTKGEAMPLDMRAKVIKAFSQLPQKILWKYEKDIPSLPKNIKLIQWAPQQDILAHPQLRLFITHGGGLSLSEAAYHGCPVLGFPLSADQLGNMAQAKRHGVGEYLPWRTFTSQEFLDTIKRMISDKSYKERSMQASVLLKDRPQNPVETAAYWIEYVVRHNGAHFLKSSAAHLNFLQYFLLDILAALLAVLIIIGVVLFYCVKLSCRRLVSLCSYLSFCKETPPKKSKSKKKSN